MKDNENISELKSHIGYWLRMVSNAVSHSFANRLSVENITVAEWVILREMYSIENALSSSMVADMTGLSRGAVSKLIDRLFHKNLVLRSTAIEDRRYQEIQLTQQAKMLVPKLAAIADANDESYFSVLNESEKRLLMKLVMKLAKRHKLNANPIE